MQNTITITNFTDPLCPFAYSAEPTRRRLEWLFGDQLEWNDRMIVLSGYNSETSPVTPEMAAKVKTRLSASHGMPMNITPATRQQQSYRACAAYIAVKIHHPDIASKFLRLLRIASMNNETLDNESALHQILSKLNIELETFTRWTASQETEDMLRSDAEDARNPTKQALAFMHKLSKTSDGRTRYSAPSYVFSSSEETIAALPGFWPIEAYEAIIGNYAPHFTRNIDPSSVDIILRWAVTPLATAEIAAVYNKSLSDTRVELEKVATYEPHGTDGFWSLNTNTKQ